MNPTWHIHFTKTNWVGVDMNKVLVITSWVEGATRHPTLDEQFPSIVRMDDVTGQDVENITPDPNLVVVQIECDDATLAAIEETGAVLQSEVIDAIA